MNLNFLRLTRGAAVLTASLLVAFLAGCSSSEDAVFTDSPTPPTAASTGAQPSQVPQTQTDATYDVAKFHVGDTLTITFSGLPDSSMPITTTITEDGSLALPDIGKVHAAGLSVGELQNAIHDRYVPAFYTHITITITIADRVFFVRGEVKNPGRLVYTAETTVTKAISAAGDFTDFASTRKVKLIRASGTTITVNCKRVLNGDETDPPVYPGDQIFVPRTIW